MSSSPPASAQNTLLLVFLHGFKGTDYTFLSFPQDLRALLAHTLPRIHVRSLTYPQYETRGDLAACVGKFRGWLVERVKELEAEAAGEHAGLVGGRANSVRVVLCGHSMGGIVAAETLLSIARGEGEEVLEKGVAGNTTMGNNTMANGGDTKSEPVFFPYIQGVLAFDTPYLGISPGVLAHGAEEQFNHATTSYKAFDTARSLFGWGGSSGAAPPANEPVADSAAKGLPAPSASGSGWGKWAMYGGAAAAIAGAAGAAYMNWNQINHGLAWATSHLEFVGCLARSAELQKRVENVVALTKSHGVGFADYYTALGEKAANKTKYAGAVVGETRTFCVVPRISGSAAETDTVSAQKSASSRDASNGRPPAKRRREDAPESKEEKEESKRMHEGEQVRQYAKDTRRDKGTWVKCVNDLATDEVTAHTAMFTPKENPGYHVMLPQVRDRIVEWVTGGDAGVWYQSSGSNGGGEFGLAEDVDGDVLGEDGGMRDSPTVSVD